MENPIENIQAQLTSQDKLITLEWAEGKARYKGKEGSVRATGKILIRSLQYFDYDLSAVAFDLPVKYDLGDIYGLVDAELEINGYDPPKITGNVTVKEATYYEEFSSPEVSAAIEAADTSRHLGLRIALPASARISDREKLGRQYDRGRRG